MIIIQLMMMKLFSPSTATVFITCDMAEQDRTYILLVVLLFCLFFGLFEVKIKQEI